MRAFGVVMFCILGVVGLLAIGWVVQGNSFFMYQMFAPKYEQVRRNTFEQSKAYNQGMVQELQNMQFEYLRANDDQKAALASIILHRAADYPPDELMMHDPNLYAFIQSLRQQGH